MAEKEKTVYLVDGYNFRAPAEGGCAVRKCVLKIHIRSIRSEGRFRKENIKISLLHISLHIQEAGNRFLYVFFGGVFHPDVYDRKGGIPDGETVFGNRCG